jgi:hypothetical protein
MKPLIKISLLVLLAIPLAISLTAETRADTYHRFWRGVKLSQLSETQLQDGLNQVFIAATIQTGSDHGLIAYEPALTGASPALPDEIALVSYQDQAAYTALFATDAGKAYVALHWNYFDKAQSLSLVPGHYTGQVAVETSYDLHPSYAGWQSGKSTVQVSFRAKGKTPESDSDYLQRIKTELDQAMTDDDANGILGRVVLVNQQYWIEYLSSNKPIKGTSSITLPIDSEASQSAKITPGHGVNVQF